MVSLFSEVREFDRQGQDLLIVIPFYNEYPLLFEHLERLSKQTVGAFDVIVVMEPGGEVERVARFMKGKKLGFGLVAAVRKENSGCSGGIFAGQRYALENGYRYMILTDVDCLPYDKDLVEELMKNKERGLVGSINEADGEKPQIDEQGYKTSQGAGFHYQLYSSELIRRYGLCYKPLYYGADDCEYSERIKERSYIVRRYYQHSSEITYRKFDKYWLYTTNTAHITGVPKAFFRFLGTVALSLPMLLLFFPGYGRKTFLGLLKVTLLFTIGKESKKHLESGFASFVVQENELAGSFLRVDYSGKGPGLALRGLPALFRKRVVLTNVTSGLAATLTSIAPKKAYMEVDDGHLLLIADNESLPLHLLKILGLFFLLPLFLAPYLLLASLVKALKTPHTTGYGLTQY